MVTGVVPSIPWFLPLIFIAHRVQQSHCSSIFHRVLLTHALALSASQFVHKEHSLRMYTSIYSAGLELMKLTYTRLEDNLIHHRIQNPTNSRTAAGNECSVTMVRQSWSLISAVPCQTTIPALTWNPALSRGGDTRTKVEPLTIPGW